MGTTQSDIRRWLETGRDKGATHVAVFVDSFDYDDYPVYIMPVEDVRERIAGIDGKNMQRIMEVYNLNMDFNQQLNQVRAFNY